MKALARADEVRFARAALKRQIKAGEVSCVDVLKEHPVPADLATMRVEELLSTVRGLRIEVIHSWLHSVPIKLTASLGDLTYRKRRVLADKLEAWEAKREAHGSDGRAIPQVTGVGGSRKLTGHRGFGARRVA